MEKVAEINSLVRSKTRNDLVAMCKGKNLPCTGTKHDMAVRLLGGLSEKKDKSSTTTPSPVIPKVVIQRKNNRWVFQDIVFDDRTRNAYAVLMPDGTLGSLQRYHISVCKKYKFKYVLPEILDERPDVPEKVRDDSSDEEFEEEEEGEEEEV